MMPNCDDDSTFGERLRDVRHERGLSQQELAWGAGFAAKTICKLERGHESPRLVTMEKLAAALECSVARLVEDGTT